MGQEILTSVQKIVIAEIAKEPKMKDFYLSGGTALAAYFLKHRFSDDLDFFIDAKIDKVFLRAFIGHLKKALGANEVKYDRLFDRNIFVFKIKNEELKTEFTYYPFCQFEKPMIRDGIKIDSFRDISSNKLMALLDRFDPKDFFDLYFILQKSALEDIRIDVEEKFGLKINNIFLGSEFAKARRIEALPKAIETVTIKELKDFFSQKAKELGKDIFEQGT